MVKTMGMISANFTDSLGSITEQRSLSSLPFGGRYRMIDFALSSMTNSGINTVCLITPFIYRSILDHVGAGKEWGLNRKVGGLLILPGAVFGMRNKGGKFLMRDLIQNRVSIARSNAELILMMSSDKIFNFDFSEVLEDHHKSGRDITLFYKQVAKADNTKGSYLCLNKAGELTNIKDEAKGKANKFMDCFIIRRKLLLEIIDNYANAAHLDITETIIDNISEFGIATHEFKNYVQSITSIADYMKCSKDLLSLDVQTDLFRSDRTIYTKTQDSAPTRYRESASVSNSIIPTGCEIEGTVENSILFRGVKVGAGAVVRNSILLQRSVVEDNAVLEGVICDKGVVISAGTKLFGTAGNPCIMAKSEAF